jgi:hypothetical protein
MDERVMHMWIDKVLKPYVRNFPMGVAPVLMLNSYRCHMMKPVINAIEDWTLRCNTFPMVALLFTSPLMLA